MKTTKAVLSLNLSPSQTSQLILCVLEARRLDAEALAQGAQDERENQRLAQNIVDLTGIIAQLPITE
jgi:hypothetical protein